MKCTSPSRSKHDAATPVLHGWDGILGLANHVQLQTIVRLFYGGFGVAVSSLLNGLSGYVDIGYVSSSIFTRSFAVVLGLICTFHTKVSSSLGDTARLLPERYDGCVVPWCLYLRTIVCTGEHCTFRRLEIAPKDEPDLWKSTIFFPHEVLADIF